MCGNSLGLCAIGRLVLANVPRHYEGAHKRKRDEPKGKEKRELRHVEFGFANAKQGGEERVAHDAADAGEGRNGALQQALFRIADPIGQDAGDGG